MLKAYLQFGGAFCGLPKGPFQTLDTEVKEDRLDLRRAGQSGRSKSGYGQRITTQYKVKHNGRWYRVYACCFSNAETLYIGPSKQPIATVNICKGK